MILAQKLLMANSAPRARVNGMFSGFASPGAGNRMELNTGSLLSDNTVGSEERYLVFLVSSLLIGTGESIFSSGATFDGNTMVNLGSLFPGGTPSSNQNGNSYPIRFFYIKTSETGNVTISINHSDSPAGTCVFVYEMITPAGYTVYNGASNERLGGGPMTAGGQVMSQVLADSSQGATAWFAMGQTFDVGTSDPDLTGRADLGDNTDGWTTDITGTTAGGSRSEIVASRAANGNNAQVAFGWPAGDAYTAMMTRIQFDKA